MYKMEITHFSTSVPIVTWKCNFSSCYEICDIPIESINQPTKRRTLEYKGNLNSQ